MGRSPFCRWRAMSLSMSSLRSPSDSLTSSSGNHRAWILSLSSYRPLQSQAACGVCRAACACAVRVVRGCRYPVGGLEGTADDLAGDAVSDPGLAGALADLVLDREDARRLQLQPRLLLHFAHGALDRRLAHLHPTRCTCVRTHASARHTHTHHRTRVRTYVPGRYHRPRHLGLASCTSSTRPSPSNTTTAAITVERWVDDGLASAASAMRLSNVRRAPADGRCRWSGSGGGDGGRASVGSWSRDRAVGASASPSSSATATTSSSPSWSSPSVGLSSPLSLGDVADDDESSCSAWSLPDLTALRPRWSESLSLSGLFLR